MMEVPLLSSAIMRLGSIRNNLLLATQTTATVLAALSADAVHAMSSSSTPMSSVAVVGVGVLGSSLCRQILHSPEFSHAVVTGITRTSNNHEAIRTQVLGNADNNERKEDDEQRFRLQRSTDPLQHKFQNVVFCAPPSGFEDYSGSVKEATEQYWDGPDAGGIFVFTSSGAVYGPGDSSVVTETSPLAAVDSSPRVARLINAERASLEAGGCCLRLAGLYSLQRGPHNFWMTSGKPVKGGPHGIINLLHYDDAASACVAALRAGPSVCRGRAFLISDGHPLTRMEICTSALQAAVYRDYGMPEFEEAVWEDTGGDKQQQQQPRELVALGKVYDGSASNTALNWKPQYDSFDAFMKANS